MFPDQDRVEDMRVSVQEFKDHEAWSRFLKKEFGAGGPSYPLLQARPYQGGDDSACFYAPAEFHIGQLNVSLLYKNLPNHFLMHYGYQFVYQMKCTLREMRMQISKDGWLI